MWLVNLFHFVIHSKSPSNLLGVLYTQLIKDKSQIYESNFDSQEKLSNPAGSILQLLSITVEASIKGFILI